MIDRLKEAAGLVVMATLIVLAVLQINGW